MMKRWSRVLITPVMMLGLLVSGGLAVSQPATTSQRATYQVAYEKPHCKHKSKQHIVRKYKRGFAYKNGDGGLFKRKYPLRCGTKHWGYRHIAHRWSKTYARRLRHTIEGPTYQRQVHGDSYAHCHWIGGKKAWFKVINTKLKSGHGVITAVREDRHHYCAKHKPGWV